MSPSAGGRHSSAEGCIFNWLDHLGPGGIHFAGDSLLSPPGDDDILMLPLRPSSAPETSHDAPDNATRQASGSAPSCGSVGSLARPGLALGSGGRASGSNEPQLNLSGAIASFPCWSWRRVQDTCAPSTRVWVTYLCYPDYNNRLSDQAGLQEVDSIGARSLPLHRHQ